MNTILSFMDKLYSDSKTLSMVYVVGAILLFIFIIMLILSLRKSTKNEEEEPKIIEEPNISDSKEDSIVKVEESVSNEQVNEELKEEMLTEQSIFEKTIIIPLDELNKKEDKSEIEQALNNVETYKKEEETVEEKESVDNISTVIPSVDEFVDNVVKKAYEKNEQFSSVYVGNNTSTIKLDKVMENLNVDEDVKESIVPDIEKTEKKTEEPVKVEEEIKVLNTDTIPEVKEESPKVENSLDNLKIALEDKKREVNSKQDELKAKLASLKKENTVSKEALNADDLLNKLNEMKEK